MGGGGGGVKFTGADPTSIPRAGPPRGPTPADLRRKSEVMVKMLIKI
jgi:hypothetical protein